MTRVITTHTGPTGRMGNKGQTNYSASKAGVIGLTRTAAKDLGQFSIRVNCICPGFIRTPMVDTVPEHVRIRMGASA